MGADGDKVSHFWVFQFLGEERKSTLVAESQDRNSVSRYEASLLVNSLSLCFSISFIIPVFFGVSLS